MKKVLFLIVAIIVSGCCMASEPQKKDISKAEAKRYIAQGWKPIPGFKPIKEQLQDLQQIKDTALIIGIGSETADDLISAHKKVYYMAILDAVEQYNQASGSILSNDVMSISSQSSNQPVNKMNDGSRHSNWDTTFFVEGVADYQAKESGGEKSEKWESEYFIELFSILEDVNDQCTVSSYVEGYVNTSRIVSKLCVYRTTKDGKIEVYMKLHAPAGSISLKKPVLQDH